MSSLLGKLIRYSKSPSAGALRLYSKMSEYLVRFRYSRVHHGQMLQRYPVIWIRTPKCASSSIVVALEAVDGLLNWNADPSLSIDDGIAQRKVICVGADNKAKFIERHPEIWHSAFRWAVVRNPYDRAVSAWRYLDSLRGRPLRDVLEKPPSREDSVSDYHHFTRPFFEMLSLNGELIVQKVVKYEDLDGELKDLFGSIGLPYRGLPRANVTPNKKPYVEYLDQHTVALIEKLYAADFRAFDYPIGIRDSGSS